MTEIIFLVEEAPAGGYTARALGESIFTEADTAEDLREAVRDAVRCHFEEANRPNRIRLRFVREEAIATATRALDGAPLDNEPDDDDFDGGLTEARAEMRAGKGIPHDKVIRRLELS